MDHPVSVIVPIYNASTVLAECLGNLLHQTLSGVQVIAVDDASTDSSPEICRAAEQQFPEQFLFLRQDKNRGPGAARNLGMKNAAGRYIGFCDADDLADPSMYEKLFALAEAHHSQIADGAFFQESTGRAMVHVSADLSGDMNDEKRAGLIACGGYCWTKLFRRDFLLENHLFFREAYSLEDMDFIMDALMKADRIDGLSEVVYDYRDRRSVSLSKVSDPDAYCESNRQAMLSCYERLSDSPRYQGKTQQAAEYAMLNLYKNIVICALKNKKHGRDPKMLALLYRAREERMHCVTGDPMKNPYYVKKIDAATRRIAALCDEDPKKALAVK